MQRLEAAFDGARPQRHPGAHRLGDAPKVSGAKARYVKEIAEKPACCFRNDYRVWLGNPLQTRRKVGCLADDGAFLRFARSNQITHNDQPSGDAALTMRVRSSALTRLARAKPTASSTTLTMAVTPLSTFPRGASAPVQAASTIWVRSSGISETAAAASTGSSTTLTGALTPSSMIPRPRPHGLPRHSASTRRARSSAVTPTPPTTSMASF